MKDRSGRREARKRRRADKAERRAAIKTGAGVALTAALSVLVFGGLAAGVLIAAPRLQDRVAQRAMANPAAVVFAWPAGAGGETWLPRDVRDVMMASALQELEKRPDPFSAAALRGVADSALRSGWIQEAPRVWRDRDGAVRVDAVWRTPAAVVRREGSDYLIGTRGEVLPMVFGRGGSPLKVLVGARHEPPMEGARPRPGVVWPGADIQAGLELLALISSRPWADQVIAIDISEYAGRKELALVTRWNGKVIWGGAPSETIPGHLSTAAKLGRIDALHTRYSRIDVHKRLVDVTSVYTLVEDTATANAQP